MATMTQAQIEEAAKKFMNGSTIKELKGISNNEMEAVYSLAFNYYRSGKFDEAEKLFDFLALFDHLNAKFWMGVGAVRQVKKNFTGAIQAYAYASFLKTLPSPGSNGTLKRVLPSEQPALKSRIKMKSGSMDGILCYSGYILPSDGKPEDAIVFSIMTNNCTLPVPQVRAAITRIIALLAAGN